MTGAAMHPFLCAIASLEHKTSPRPLPCPRAKDARRCSHRETGTLRNIKDLCTTTLALFDVFGTLRRMPTFPKGANFFV
jgi:hypothetical protein